MSEITPQQMRQLADRSGRSLELVGAGDWTPQDTLLAHASAALRTAADQLEAVQQYLADGEVEDDHGQHVVYTFGLKQILTADAAPQEDCDD